MHKEQIGPHTLYLADCREVLPTLAAQSVDFVFTDPPYGHNNNDDDLISRRELALGKTKKKLPTRPIANDGEEANELVQFAFAQFSRLLAPGCCCCCCCGGGPDPQFARWSLWLDELLGFKHMIIWDKGPMGLGWHYRRSYETVLVGQKPGAPCRWFDATDSIENVIRPGKHGIRKIIPDKAQHPTEKPIELSAHFMKLHTTTQQTVLDPFMGAGTTGVACARLGRKFIGIEIDAYWFDVACKRIKAETRKVAGALVQPA